MKGRATYTHTLMATLGFVGVVAVTSAQLATRVDARRNQPQPAASPSQSRSVWDGVYTDDQAKRGESAYLGECTRCHGESLVGSEGGPPLVGDTFLEGWSTKTAADLFRKIGTSMPADSPGGLSRQQATDIMAFIFHSNKFPASEKALEPDPALLQLIKIEARRSGR